MLSELFIVATPIGNLKDITPRALEVLQQADVVLAEDTRVTQKIFNYFGFKPKKIVSYYDEVEITKSRQVIENMKTTPMKVCLVSDAGTPCISDPGYHLVKCAHENHIRVTPIPGASSLTCLLSASGLPPTRVLYVGFLPQKSTELKKEILSWLGFHGSVVFHTRMSRLEANLQCIADAFEGNGVQVAIGRELTKLHEEILSCSLLQALAWIQNKDLLKGEVSVQVFLPKPSTTEEPLNLRDEVLNHLRQFPAATVKDLLPVFSEKGRKRSELYQRLLEIMSEFKEEKHK